MNTRELILETALKGFLEKGFEKISLNELIRRSGLTKGAFYYHFKSKNELLSEVVQKYLHGYIGQHIENMNNFDGTILDKINMVIKKVTDVKKQMKKIAPKGIDSRAFMFLLQDGLKNDATLRAYNNATQKVVLGKMETLFLKGQQDGEIRTDIDVKQMVALLSACINGVIFDVTIVEDAIVEKRMKENISTLIKLFSIA